MFRHACKESAVTYSRSLLTFGLFVLMAINVAEASNAPSFQPVSPQELAMTSEPLAPGAPAVILFRRVDRDDNDGREFRYYRIKILTEEGRKYADVEVAFFDSYYTIEGVAARTIHPDGSIVNFSGKPYDKTVLKARQFKVLAKTFTLPDVQVGSVIEYYYWVRMPSWYVYGSHWNLSDDMFTRRAQFSLKPYQGDYGLRMSWRHLPSGVAEPQQSANGVIRLDASNIPALQKEDFMPPDGEVEARVDFTYHRRGDPNDPDKFWKQTGQNLNDDLEQFISKRNGIDTAVSQTISPTDTQEVKLQKLYARVQQLRNTSYEAEKSEQEQKRSKEKPPGNVSELWKRGYGDSVTLTWLFVAMARVAGFEAYGAWVAPRDRYFFDPKIMDAFALRANVAVVMLDGKTRFFDPGSAFAPFGVLPWHESGVTALVLNKDGGSWMEIPAEDSAHCRIERVAMLKLAADGTLEGKLTIKYTGAAAMEERADELNQDDADRKKYLEQEVKDLIPVGCDVELKNHPDWNSSADPFLAEFQITVPGWATEAGHRELLPVGVFTAGEKNVFEHASRVYPVYIKYPFQKVDDVTVELPSGWKVDKLPKPQAMRGGAVISYEMNFEGSETRLNLKRKLAVDFLLLDTPYYGALRNFYQAVGTSDDAQIILQAPATQAGRN